jgi:hypothetical protein
MDCISFIFLTLDDFRVQRFVNIQQNTLQPQVTGIFVTLLRNTVNDLNRWLACTECGVSVTVMIGGQPDATILAFIP